MNTSHFIIAAIGLIFAPIIHGFSILITIPIISSLTSPIVRKLLRKNDDIDFYYRIDLIWRCVFEFGAATLTTWLTLFFMMKFGYHAGWIWLILLSLFFTQNYYYRSSKGILVRGGFYLLLSDFSGFFAAGILFNN